MSLNLNGCQWLICFILKHDVENRNFVFIDVLVICTWFDLLSITSAEIIQEYVTAWTCKTK